MAAMGIVSKPTSQLACGGWKPGRLHRSAFMLKNVMSGWNVSIALDWGSNEPRSITKNNFSN